ncbi:MAG TPA: guanylate kinase [Blastocatellia bacterium]|nr:guanylate kinase [Blastocatellia bacterium]
MSSESKTVESESLPPERARTERGTLVVVSAPSGAGKSSLVHRALQTVAGLKFSVSYTTREARPGESEGSDYHFIGIDEFVKMRERNEFLEWAEVHGNLYGTHRGAVEETLTSGHDMILDIDVQGADQVRRQLPEAATVFILPPSLEVLRNRLEIRNQNSVADLGRRLRNAAIEVQLYDRFDYVIVNDDLDRAARELVGIIFAERQRPQRNRNRIEGIIETFGGK